jgi:UDP-N-acetylmuramate--alanine ligase
MTLSHKKEETLLHFVGIGGIGMSGIAEVFLNQGYLVTGSDQVDSDITRYLVKIGAKIHLGHSADNVHGASVVVVSSAIRKDNPELIEAKRLRVPVIPRAEMLAELMRGKVGIGVAGTHGKTTTTSMLATVLTSAGLDPTLVIGGKVDSLGGNAKLGQGHYVIAEADESDGSFLHLPATFGVVTNIDNDHLDYFGSLEAIDDAFVGFVGKLPFYGAAAVCAEDGGVRRCMQRWTKPFLTYGLSPEWDYSAEQIEFNGLSSHFKVFKSGRVCLGAVHLLVPGKHNILNALAAVTIAQQIGIPFHEVSSALSQFKGVKRRFEVRWQDRTTNRVIIDDYGHHPTEIQATLEAVRRYWSGRVITVFQPHRFSRTLHCKQGFLSAFIQSDLIFVTDIYSAGEEPIAHVSAESLVSELKGCQLSGQEFIYSGDLLNTQHLLEERFQEGDLVICLGAGSITRLPELLIKNLNEDSLVAGGIAEGVAAERVAL